MRRLPAETLYDLETECRRQGWLGADPALVYDEEQELALLGTRPTERMSHCGRQRV
jgi:hypothetical protein